MQVMGGPCNYSKSTEAPAGVDVPGFERYACMDYPLDESLLLSVFERFQQVVQKYGKSLQPSKCIVDTRNYEEMALIPSTATAYAGRYNNAWMMPDLQWDDPSLDAKMREEVTAITAFVRERLQEKKIPADVQGDGQRDVIVALCILPKSLPWSTVPLPTQKNSSLACDTYLWQPSTMLLPLTISRSIL